MSTPLLITPGDPRGVGAEVAVKAARRLGLDAVLIGDLPELLRVAPDLRVVSRLEEGEGGLRALDPLAALGKGEPVEMLVVSRMEGETLPEPLMVPWTYGSWYADRAGTSSANGLVLEVGGEYRVLGYEAGAFRGAPAGLWSVIGDDFGPPSAAGFRFEHVFRVVQVEAVR